VRYSAVQWDDTARSTLGLSPSVLVQMGVGIRRYRQRKRALASILNCRIARVSAIPRRRLLLAPAASLPGFGDTGPTCLFTLQRHSRHCQALPPALDMMSETGVQPVRRSPTSAVLIVCVAGRLNHADRHHKCSSHPNYV
jgi:hypothetical protein